jgi:ribosome-binding ATPase YchF (GTP1/OBG family)
MEKKMTKRDMFNDIIAIATELNRTDLVEFANHEIELLNKRAERNTLTKTQKENLELVEKVYEVIAALAKPVTITEIQATNEEFSTLSNQKISALLKKLVDAKRVIKVVEKNKSFYSVAE